MRKWKNPSGTRTYHSWRGMRGRCLNPKDADYPKYGGRGIKVCQRWADSYDAFVDDMGEAPEGRTIDRKDVNGDYEPDNCRWASHMEQCLNKRVSVRITHDGETKNMSEWAIHLGISRSTLFKRLKEMPLERAMSPGTLRPWSHGTRHGYQIGCRCDECRAANAKSMRDRRARLRAAK